MRRDEHAAAEIRAAAPSRAPLYAMSVYYASRAAAADEIRRDDMSAIFTLPPLPHAFAFRHDAEMPPPPAMRHAMPSCRHADAARYAMMPLPCR